MNKFYLIVLFVGCFLFSCKKDRSNPPFSIKYNNKTYEISKGTIENSGRFAGDNNIELSLFSKKINPEENNEVITSFSGNGSFIYFNLYSDSDSLSNGVYNYADNLLEQAGTFDISTFITEFSLPSSNPGKTIAVSEGSVTVQKTDKIFEITINCSDENGKSITGYYKGELNYYDYSFE